MIAQQTSQGNSQTQSKETPPSTGAPDPAPPTIVVALPSEISGPPTVKPVTRVGAEVIHAAPSTELDAYVKNSVLPLIGANWHQLIFKSKEKIPGDATVEFIILKDGSLVGSNLMDGVGHALLGDLALTAIKNSAPFSALPSDLKDPSLSVRAHFQFACAEETKDLATDRGTNSGVVGPIFRVGGGVYPPRPVFHPEPEYSEDARKKAVSGTVLLKMIVTSEGEVSNVTVAKSLGNGLDEKAIEAVKQWKFQPATKDGQPVPVLISVEVEFHLTKRDR